MSNIHVALVTPWDRRGGIATYSERFATELENASIETTIVEIKNTDATNPLAFVSLLDDVPSDADVIHVQYEAGLFGKFGLSGVGAPAFFYSLAQADIPVVVTLHEVHAEHAHRGPLGDGLLRLRDTFIERLALRTADATVVHTTQAKGVLESRHGDGWRIERMLHPTDAEAEHMSISEAKSDLGVNGPVALTFGFVEEKKRYEDVIRVLPEIPNLTYLIAGGNRKGEARAVLERVQKLAEDLNVADRIEYLGYVDKNEVRVIFSASDVVVLPYERVSQSGVVNDALAYRRPVITSSLPAFEELRTEYGCLLTYDTLPELTSQLNQILSNSKQRDTLKQNSENYVQNVSWAQFSKRTSRLYDTILTCR